MLLTPHILAGAAIITRVQNPFLGLVFVLLSHYLLDLPPQKEYSISNIRSLRWKKSTPDFLRVSLDVALGLGIVFWLIGYTPLLLAAVSLSILPDGLTLLHCIFPKNGPLKKHLKIHSAINLVCENKKIPAFWGVASQIAVAGLAIFLLI